MVKDNLDISPNVKSANVDRIKALAKSKGISMAFLCKQINKHRNFLACVRLGQDYIDQNELKIIADILGTTTDYLANKTDDPALPESKPTHKEKPADLLDNELDRELQEMLLKLSPAQQSQVKAFVAGMKSKFGG